MGGGCWGGVQEESVGRALHPTGSGNPGTSLGFQHPGQGSPTLCAHRTREPCFPEGCTEKQSRHNVSRSVQVGQARSVSLRQRARGPHGVAKLHPTLPPTRIPQHLCTRRFQWCRYPIIIPVAFALGAMTYSLARHLLSNPEVL